MASNSMFNINDATCLFLKQNNPHLQVKGPKVYFASHFVEVSVNSPLVPRQGGITEGDHREK